MKITIAKRKFNELLNIIAKAISSLAPIPSLSGVLIEAQNNKLILTGSDSNISIKAEEKGGNELNIEEEGKIVLDFRYIAEISRKIDGETITIETIDGTLVKICGDQARFNLNGMRPEDYPQIDFTLTETHFNVDTQNFLDLIRQTVFACSDKETKPALTGVNFVAHGLILRAAATDSYRLSLKRVPIASDIDFNLTVPAKFLNDVAGIVANYPTVNIYIADNRLLLTVDDIIIRLSLIEDIYPDVSNLIPENYSQVLTIDAAALNAAVDRTAFIKSDGHSIVKMIIGSEQVELSSSSQEIGSSYETLNLIAYRGDPLTVSCSGKYLSDAIKALRSDVITLSFTGELRPIILRSRDNDNIIELVSPVKTYN